MADITKRDIKQIGVGTGKVRPFSRLQAVREFLLDEAKSVAQEYRLLAQEAVRANRPDIAEVVLWKLLSHMPREEGVTIVDPDASKPAPTQASSAPAIQIGVVLGGMKKEQAQLEGHTPAIAEVIDVTPRKGQDVKIEAVTEGTKD